MSFPKRTDGNQNEMVKFFRQMGCSVFICSGVGHGFPDLVLGLRGHNYLIELKDGKKPPSMQKLTEKEKLFHDTWKGQVVVLNSIDSAILFLNQISNKDV